MPRRVDMNCTALCEFALVGCYLEEPVEAQLVVATCHKTPTHYVSHWAPPVSQRCAARQTPAHAPMSWYVRNTVACGSWLPSIVTVTSPCRVLITRTSLSNGGASSSRGASVITPPLIPITNRRRRPSLPPWCAPEPPSGIGTSCDHHTASVQPPSTTPLNPNSSPRDRYRRLNKARPGDTAAAQHVPPAHGGRT